MFVDALDGSLRAVKTCYAMKLDRLRQHDRGAALYGSRITASTTHPWEDRLLDLSKTSKKVR